MHLAGWILFRGHFFELTIGEIETASKQIVVPCQVNGTLIQKQCLRV
jgi:hypothetical protein